MSHDGNLVFINRTYILAGYTVPCSGTVVAWEFCYQVFDVTSVTFYPGIWRIAGTIGGNINYELVQSNSVTYDQFIQTGGNNSCKRVNLSTTDQFTAPAGSVVGLYSNIKTALLRTKNDHSIANVGFKGNESSISITGNSSDSNYNIAIRVHIGKTV